MLIQVDFLSRYENKKATIYIEMNGGFSLYISGLNAGFFVRLL